MRNEYQENVVLDFFYDSIRGIGLWFSFQHFSWETINKIL